MYILTQININQHSVYLLKKANLENSKNKLLRLNKIKALQPHSWLPISGLSPSRWSN